MIFSKVKTVEYVPNFGGNANDSEPAVVLLKVFTAAEMEELGEIIRNGAKTSDMFRYGFAGARNFLVTGENGEIREAKTADDVLAIPGIYDLIKECAGKVIEINTISGEEKNE